MFARNLSRKIVSVAALQKCKNFSSAATKSKGHVFASFALKAMAVGVVYYSAVTDGVHASPAKPTDVNDKFASTAMFPPLAAYEKATIKVSDIHTVAYSCYGNPKGKAVLLVHGGPGGGTDPGIFLFTRA
jgi:hypothetical protein